MLEQPISVQAGEKITGELRLIAHSRQSYDVYLQLTGPPLTAGFPPQKASFTTRPRSSLQIVCPVMQPGSARQCSAIVWFWWHMCLIDGTSELLHDTQLMMQASGKLDLKEPYYRQLCSWAPSPATGGDPAAPVH